MATQLNSVLERLRAFGADKLAELDGREQEHRGWLAAAVEEVRAQIAALAPAAKRQRLDAAGAAKATQAEEEEQVRAVQSCPGLAAALAQAAAPRATTVLPRCRRLSPPACICALAALPATHPRPRPAPACAARRDHTGQEGPRQGRQQGASPRAC